jgi:hypothetical protein
VIDANCKMTIYRQDRDTVGVACSTHGAQRFPQLLVMSSSDSSISLNTGSDRMDIISKTNTYLIAPHQLTNHVGRRLKRVRDKIARDRRQESGSFGGMQQENTRENLR